MPRWAAQTVLAEVGVTLQRKKKPPPPVWPASDLKKGMTSACTSRGASVRGRGPFHSGPHPQESEWGSCQALGREEEEEEEDVFITKR